MKGPHRPMRGHAFAGGFLVSIGRQGTRLLRVACCVCFSEAASASLLPGRAQSTGHRRTHRFSLLLRTISDARTRRQISPS